MTNEEKAFEITNKDRTIELLMPCKPSYYDGLLQGAMEAMKWKDEQFEKERQQLIDKACIELCKNCSQLYGNCEEWCKRKPAFKKAMRGE